MLVERIEENWIAAHARVLEPCPVTAGDSTAIRNRTTRRDGETVALSGRRAGDLAVDDLA